MRRASRRSNCAHARIIAAGFGRTMSTAKRDIDVLRLKVCGIGQGISDEVPQLGANPWFPQ
ncbi:MAG: hypothetical protein PPHEESC_5663 [uncultured Paraburkholderia sp.]|nr:MAG: hypothetical protein PPHEESC_5663 [uncultured Paraburkholderia sp.]CAH2941823.1 MAG: hypothetical protein PPHEMADMSA_5669 [uncultured Paraburkholderia sp.]